ncbi:MAG TPA: substrate-binding domain-containing protein [Albitalea sp.]|nr:substrate-binding domain-containing protein [Albitalea sp.]
MARNPDSGAAQQIVTLAMVAEEAGVSPSTVSRILTGNARVSDDKRKAVEDAIAKLHYEPNVLARGLAQGRTLSVGVLTQDIVSPFYGEAMRGIEDELMGTGIVPLFVSGHWNLHDEVERMAHLLSRRVDGVIVLTGRLADEQLREYARRLPIVVTGRSLKGHNIASLRVDDFKGAHRATQHLIELGHRRIAHIAGPQDHADSVERLKGYRKALEEAGIAFDPKLVAYADFHEPSGVLAINQLMEARLSFSAVFASNDQTAYGARLALYQRNIRVPEDISLIGFDDLPVSRYVIPPLSTIHQPVYELGQAAARVLLGLIDGARSRVTLPEPQLVVRESTRRLHG